jgi:hypothetical protein
MTASKEMRLVPRLSALTPAVVDQLYGIDRAEPVAHPLFVILAGSPGVGKSSGHAAAEALGLTAPYATINLDTLLESLAPFRAASSMAHFLKQDPDARDLTRFASITAYGTRRENLGLFKWYDTARPELAAAGLAPETLAAFNAVRAEFAPLADAEAPARLMDINAAAMVRAIAKRVPIVWETTLSLAAKSGRVAKIDDLMEELAGTPYRVLLIHATGDPADIAARIRARQEYGMPYEVPPYYRYVKATPESVAEYVAGNAAAVAALRSQYRGRIEFHEIAPVLDPARLPRSRRMSPALQRARIAAFYGPEQEIPRSLRLSSSNSLRLSSSNSNRRRTTKRKSSPRS